MVKAEIYRGKTKVFDAMHQFVANYNNLSFLKTLSRIIEKGGLKNQSLQPFSNYHLYLHGIWSMRKVFECFQNILLIIADTQPQDIKESDYALLLRSALTEFFISQYLLVKCGSPKSLEGASRIIFLHNMQEIKRLLDISGDKISLYNRLFEGNSGPLSVYKKYFTLDGNKIIISEKNPISLTPSSILKYIEKHHSDYFLFSKGVYIVWSEYSKYEHLSLLSIVYEADSALQYERLRNGFIGAIFAVRNYIIFLTEQGVEQQEALHFLDRLNNLVLDSDSNSVD